MGSGGTGGTRGGPASDASGSPIGPGMHAVGIGTSMYGGQDRIPSAQPVTAGAPGAAARQQAIAMGPAALTSSNPSIRYAALHLQQEAADRAAGTPEGAPQPGQPGYVRR